MSTMNEQEARTREAPRRGDEMDIAKIQNALRRLEPHLSVRELDYVDAAVRRYADLFNAIEVLLKAIDDAGLDLQLEGPVMQAEAALTTQKGIAHLEASTRFAQNCLRNVAEIIDSGQPASTDYIRIACGMGTDEWRACGGPLFADLTVFCHEHNFNEWQAETMFRKEKKP